MYSTYLEVAGKVCCIFTIAHALLPTTALVHQTKSKLCSCSVLTVATFSLSFSIEGFTLAPPKPKNKPASTPLMLTLRQPQSQQNY